MADDIVIKAEGVSKEFKLPHEKHSSLKHAAVNIFSSNRGYERQQALKDVSFEVKKGEFFGIVGRNGSGKSTLLKMLAGIYQPTKGKISVQGKLVPFIELGVGFNPELTGKENVFLNGALLGFTNKEIEQMYDEIVKFAELEKFMDQKLKNYSSGMQVRLAFSMAVRSEADILLIDEVLAVGDADFQRKCFEYFKLLKRNKTTVVFVSHDMAAIKEFCDRAMLIDKSEVAVVGDTSEVSKRYAELFMENKLTHGMAGDRWGNKSVVIESVDARVSQENIEIKVDLLAKKDIETVIYGLHINSSDGSEVTAANNRMLNMKDIKCFNKGQKMQLSWKIQNIFNDGVYDITLTFVDDVTNALDWWEGATSFEVKRLQRSTTSVLPPISVVRRIIKQ